MFGRKKKECPVCAERRMYDHMRGLGESRRNLDAQRRELRVIEATNRAAAEQQALTTEALQQIRDAVSDIASQLRKLRGDTKSAARSKR